MISSSYRRIAPSGLRSLLLAAVLFLAAAATGDAEPVTEDLSFEVWRDGESIGTHALRFTRDGDRLYVDIDVALAVKVLFVTAYRYEQERREVWKDGRLVAFGSKTHDDGTDYDIRGALRDGEILVTGGTNPSAPADAIPNSYWHSDMIRRPELLDTIDGTMLAVSFTDGGEETIEAGGRKLAARRYLMGGKRPRELWYDDAGRWVKMRTTGSDGSVVEWLLK